MREASAVNDQRLGDVSADAHHRVECSHRLLEDESDPGAADLAHLGFRQRQQVAALEEHLAAGDAARFLQQAG